MSSDYLRQECIFIILFVNRWKFKLYITRYLNLHTHVDPLRAVCFRCEILILLCDDYFYDFHYIDVIMTTMASQITSLTVVYSTVYSDADQRKHQSSASLAFVWGIHRDRWIPRTKGQLRGKCFHLMTSSCVCGWREAVLLMCQLWFS